MRKEQNLFVIFLVCILVCCWFAAHPRTPVYYTVRFLQGDMVLSEQQVRRNRMPVIPETEAPVGTRFAGWDSAVEKAEADAVYSAVFLPTLEEHAPYLQADETGALCPDDPFTMDAMAFAIKALSGDAASAYLPELPKGKQAVKETELLALLAQFLPDAELPESNDRNVLTRGEAACLINSILGRENEKVQPDTAALGFPDVTRDREDYSRLMEAAVNHSRGEKTWEELNRLKTAHPSGWEFRQGQLYYYDEEGYPVRDTVVEGVFTMDARGHYTSGNPTLDALVSKQLSRFQRENPRASREELLRCAYDYTRDSFKYLRRDDYEFGQVGWETEDAISMMETGLGNCYNYAAVFWALARGLGYDAQAISGCIHNRRAEPTPHGWVRIDLEDGVYYYDPEIEMTRDKSLGLNLYKMEREYAIGIWHYEEPE